MLCCTQLTDQMNAQLTETDIIKVSNSWLEGRQPQGRAKALARSGLRFSNDP